MKRPADQTLDISKTLEQSCWHIERVASRGVDNKSKVKHKEVQRATGSKSGAWLLATRSGFTRRSRFLLSTVCYVVLNLQTNVFELHTAIADHQKHVVATAWNVRLACEFSDIYTEYQPRFCLGSCSVWGEMLQN